MDQENGMEQLYALADRFEEAGIFDDGPWDELTNLQPKFVKGALMAGGTNATLEILSELRILSLAEEDHESEDMSSEEAQEFLNEVMALNMDLIFPEETEDRKSTRLNSSHVASSYAVFCMKKKKKYTISNG